MYRAQQKKSEKHRAQLVVGGNRINFPGEVGTLTNEMLLVKIMLISIILTSGEKFMTIDIANFFLATPMVMLTKH